MKLILSTFLFVLTISPLISAQPAAPGPTPSSTNITEILEKEGNYRNFILLLISTRIDVQLNSQINNSFNGLTILCPTDNAFQSLEAGFINSLSQEEQVQLMLYNVMPRYYSLQTFTTAPNPIPTQSQYTFNVSVKNNQVNITTGYMWTFLGNGFYTSFPLAMYSIEKVLLPPEMFEAKPPKASPPPPPKAKAPAPKGSAPAEGDSSSPAAGDGGVGLRGGLKGLVMGMLGFVVLGFGGSMF